MSLDKQAYTFGLRTAAFAAVCLLSLAAFDGVAPRLPVAWVARIPDAPDHLAELRGAGGRVLYLGDSAVAAAGVSHPNRLWAALALELDVPISSVAQGAFAVESHLAQLRHLDQLGVEPAAVVIPINLRAFGPIWEENPSWNFGLQDAMYTRPLLARALAVFKYDFGRRNSEELAESWIVVRGERIGNLARDVVQPDLREVPSSAELRRRFLASYASDIRASRRLPILDELLAWLEERRLPVLLYLTPLNMERMNRLLDAGDLRSVEANLEVLRSRLARSHLPWIDLSASVSAQGFDLPHTVPHEHLTPAACAATARAIAQALRPILRRRQRSTPPQALWRPRLRSPSMIARHEATASTVPPHAIGSHVGL